MSQPDNLWNAHSRQWRLIGSPLRPGPQDIARYGRVLADWQGGRVASDAARAPGVLLLGVTPEIASLPWSRGASLVAADHSYPMIDRLWREQTFSEISAGAVCADWKRLPLADASRDIAIGDGCFSAVDFPGSYRALIASLNRVLRPDGLFAIRLFLRPDRPEAVEAVFALLEAGRIGNFHVFKWRLAQALHGNLANGVELDAIWRTWRAFVPAPEALAEKLGWPMEVLATIDAYRGSAVRYTFPTLDEMRASLAAAFTETGCFFPDYELGERCPILALRPAAMNRRP
jgi:SAM-dependent methyltransferase